MAKEYTSTLVQLKMLRSSAENVNLTLDRQMEFDENVKGYLDSLIEDIEVEGTEAS